jgi:hypothetical protein
LSFSANERIPAGGFVQDAASPPGRWASGRGPPAVFACNEAIVSAALDRSAASSIVSIIISMQSTISLVCRRTS